jgi:N-acetylglucosaminyldiphosphoundecaprenol N-acetyl-beta-D-mannosaminyltransferase
VSSAKLVVSPLTSPSVQLSSLPRANVLGVGVHAIDLNRAVEVICAAVATERKGYVCVTGVHGVMEAQRNPDFRAILDQALLVAPDGTPTVWVGRLQGHSGMERVFGPDLMSEVCSRSVAEGYSHFLYGGKPGIGEDLRQRLTRRFPGIRIVGTYTPPFRALSSRELADLEESLAELRPDIIWIGLSTPKQEQFMAETIQRLPCKVMVGVGAAFDFHTGQLRDAPPWVKNLGLQWLDRLCQEPSRLWKRYLINNSSFLFRIALQMTRVSSYSLDAPNGSSKPRLDL